jgi:hypothetical protein
VKGCTQRFLFGLSLFDQPITKKQKNKTRKQKNKMKQKTIKRTSHQNKIIAHLPLCPALEVMIFEFGQTL